MEKDNLRLIKVIESSISDQKSKKVKNTILFALFTLGSLVLAACSPAKAEKIDTIPASSPSYTVQATSTIKPTPSPTITPVATPEVVNINMDEIISKLNITNPELVPLTSVVIYECTFPSGKKVKFMVYLWYHLDKNGDFVMLHKNIFDNEVFSTFLVKKNKEGLPEKQVKNWNDMENFDIKLVPEFLKDAKITAMYGLTMITNVYKYIKNQEIPKNPLLDFIVERMAYLENHPEEGETDVLNSTFPTFEEYAEAYALLSYPDEIVYASDYIEGYVPKSPIPSATPKK